MLNIEKMKKASYFAAKILEEIYEFVECGMTKNDINDFCKERMKFYRVKSASYKYNGTYPSHCCISVNNEVCHGIHSNYVLNSGDILSIDVSLSYDGYFGDNCASFIILNKNENICEEIKKRIKLVEASWQVTNSAIKIVKTNLDLNKIGEKIENTAKKLGFYIVKEFCGHFIGTKLHLLPDVLCYKNYEYDYKLKVGDCFTIEPILITKKSHIFIDKNDKWTAFAKNALSSQFENTIMVTDNGYEILTKNTIWDRDKKFIKYC